MALTQEQIDALNGVNLSPQQSKNALGFSNNIITNALSNGWQQVSGMAQQGVQQIEQATAPNQDNSLTGEMQRGLDVASGAATVASSPIAPAMSPINKAINWLGNKIGSIPGVQQFANTPAGEVTSGVAKDVGEIANVAGTVAGVKGSVSISPKAVDLAQSVSDYYEKAKATSDAKTTQAGLKDVAQAWEKPATIAKSGYNNARAVLSKTPSIPKFLAEQKVNPWQHIDETGNFDTADTATALRATAGQMSSDTLRPSLQMADYSTPKTTLDEVIAIARSYIQKDSGLTASDKINAIKGLEREGSALAQKYNEGMGLVNMHDEKITYAQNSGYSPIKDPAANIKASTNRALSSALGDLVEKKAPEGVPVRAFNKYLSDYYKSADYLDAIHGKKVPQSVGQKIAYRAAEVLGAGAGHAIGGGLLGGVGGYMIGGALEHAIEHMTTSMRGSFLSNLEISNPEAFARVQQYFKNANMIGGKLALPPVTSDTPISTPYTQGTPGINYNLPIKGE